MIGDYRGESSNEKRLYLKVRLHLKQNGEGLHLRTLRSVESAGESGREEEGVSGNILCVNCDEIDSGEEDRGGEFPTG